MAWKCDPRRSQLLEGKTGDAFEPLVLRSLSDQGVEVGEFAAAVKALGTLRATLAELHQLPDQGSASFALGFLLFSLCPRPR